MKKSILIATFFFAFFSISIAQNTTVSIGYGALGFSTDAEDFTTALGLSYALESAISKRFTIQAEVSSLKDNIIRNDQSAWQRRVKNFSTGLNFYPKAAHEGFFIGMNVGYTKVDYKLKSNGDFVILGFPDEGPFVGGGINLGFKTSLTKRLTLGTVAGTKVMYMPDTEEGMLQFNMGANIGFRF